MRIVFLTLALPAGDKLRGTSIKEIAENYGKFPPLGLLRLASAAMKAGHETQVIDAIASGDSVRDLCSRLSRDPPDVICITLITQILPHTLKQIQRLKQELNCTIIAGGPNISLFGYETMENGVIDYSLKGSGENSLITLLKCLEEELSLEDIPGLFYRGGAGDIRSNPPLHEKRTLVSSPWPATFLIDHRPYYSLVSQHVPYTSMVTSPSCPYRCNFCEQGRTFVEPIPAKQVIAEIESLTKNRGIQEIEIFDPTFTLDKNRAREICEGIIDRGIDIKWAARTRADMVDEELLQLMAKAGCIRVYFGIESGSDEILKHYKKDLTVDRARQAVQWAKDAGILVFGFFMIGAPEETEESIRKTISLATELDLDYAQFNKVIAAPNTPLFVETSTDQNYWSPAKEVSDALPTTCAAFTEEELESWVRHAYLRFYFRPRYMAKVLGRTRSWKELRRIARVAVPVVGHVLRNIGNKALSRARVERPQMDT